MRIDNIFKPVRFGRLAANDLFSNARAMLITMGAILGLLLVVNVSSVASGNRWDFHAVFFPLTLLVGGHIVTALAFTEMHKHERGYMYLTLPGSMLEKFLVKLLLTSIGWTVAAFAAYWLFSLLAAGLTSLLFGMAHPLFNPFRPGLRPFVRLYVVTQSVTLFGAVYFKKLHLLKTILVATALGIAATVVFGLLFRLIFSQYFDGTFLMGRTGWSNAVVFDTAQGKHLKGLFETALKAIGFAFWWVVPPFFWITGYFRLRETEV